MGLLELTRDSLKDLPISDVIRERLSLALDQLADAQRQVGVLQTEKGGLQAQFERERLDHEQTKKELQRLQGLMTEEIRVVHGVEFRRGVRTSGEWLAFCPKCHLPISFIGSGADYPYCNDHDCGWISGVNTFVIRQELQQKTGAS
jgi:hypothetical protein